MQNVYAIVLNALDELIWDVYPAQANNRAAFCTEPRGCTVSTAFPLAAGENAEECACVISNRMGICSALGAPLVKQVFANSGGHLCFELTGEFYLAAVKLAMRELPLPKLPENTRSRAEYALCRMLMRSRKAGGFKGDARVTRPLWSCLALTQPGVSRAMIERAAEAVLALDELSIGEREPLLFLEGEACAAMARLLGYALGAEKGV